ncbi:MAG: isoprenyl transferase, partial [Bryobacterales bacterium]|nr:isoprenyl transferase [Bryobacterales bacterium]
LEPGSPEWTLASAVDADRLPRHIAVIMDGNGRWANQRNLPRVAGHKAGMNAVRQVIEQCARMGVRAVTLYAFSVENWKRPRTEVETLWRLLRFYVDHELPKLVDNGIQIRTMGRTQALPRDVARDLQRCVDATQGNRGLIVNIAINYGGRTEIVDAVNQAVEQARATGTLDSLEFSEELIEQNLYSRGLPDPDLLIRTSGELRISNFLLWQLAYTEIYVTPTYWPDFGLRDLLEAILDFQKRDRRFGGVRRDAVEAPAEVLDELLGVTTP